MYDWAEEFTGVVTAPASVDTALVTQAIMMLEATPFDWQSLEDVLCWILSAQPEKRGLRLMALETAVRQHPDRARLVGKIRRVTESVPATRFLAETGIADHPTVWKEAATRVVDKVFARLEPVPDLFTLLNRLPLKEEDADWLESLPEQRTAVWRNLLPDIQEQIHDAIRLLSHRINGVALSREVLALHPEYGDAQSPFYELTAATQYWLDHLEDPQARGWFEDAFGKCMKRLGEAHRRMDDRGVSLDLVYRLELLESQLERMRKLVSLASGKEPARPLLSQLVRASVRRKSVRNALSAATQRLTRRVVEHTGETGEHYLVTNAAEWKGMFLAGCGGGLITIGTALGKFLVAGMAMAPAATGMLLWANYSVSFITMQFCEFGLSSKQPAMTASALAKGMELSDGTGDEIELIAAICRSQWAVTLGNLLSTIPLSLAVALLWSAWMRVGILRVEEARHTMEAMQVLSAWSLIPLAALTGVYLWLASMVAGWAANWSAYRMFPEAVAASRGVRGWLGEAGAIWLGEKVKHHWSGVVSMLALGFFLGFVPVAWTFLGLDLPVRHVTLQASSFALACESLWWNGELHWRQVLWGLLGIGLIGCGNFFVSFYLSLRTAMRARGVEAADRRHLWRDLGERMLEAPGSFIWRGRDGGV